MNILFYDIIAWVIVFSAFVYAGYMLYKTVKLFLKKESPCAACPLNKACSASSLNSHGKKIVTVCRAGANKPS